MKWKGPFSDSKTTKQPVLTTSLLRSLSIVVVLYTEGCIISSLTAGPLNVPHSNEKMPTLFLYTLLYIVLAYLMLFAALTNAVCLYNASFFAIDFDFFFFFFPYDVYH